MRKSVLAFLVLIVAATSLFAFDLTGRLHFDTYDGSPTFGFSFDASGNILGSLQMNAKLDYFTANSYEAQCLLMGKVKFVTVGAGIAFSIDNSVKNIIVPGIGISARLDLPFNLGITADAVLSLAPANLYEAYSFRTGAGITYSTNNADSSLEYSIKQSAEKEGRIHTILFKVDAFEKGIPFALSLGFGSNFITGSDSTDFPFEFHVEGGFSISTKKAGTYLLSGKVAPVTYRDTEIPFEVCIGAMWSFK